METIASTPTHCPYCALQCGMNLTPLAAGGVEVTERPDFPVNRGALCGKGRTAAAVLSPAVRLTSPLVRSGGRLVEASWPAALDLIAERLGSTREAYGADALGVFGGGGLTHEKAYALGKFARVVLGTSQIDYNGRFCMSSAAAAGTRAFGLDRGLPFPLEDIPKTGCVILVGSNLAETMPPSLRFLQRTAGERRHVDRRRPAPDEDGRAGGPASGPSPGHRSRPRVGPVAPGGRRGADGRGVHPGADDGLGGDPGGGDGALAGAGGADHGGVRSPAPGGGTTVLCASGRDGAHRARAGAAVQGHGHGGRVDQPVPGDRPGGPPAVRVRLPDRAGQRAGRPRTRPEGRPVARLPQAGRPGGAGARGRGLGRGPGCAPRSRTQRVRAPRRPRHGRPGAAADGLQPRGVGATRAHIEERLRSLDFLAVADVVLSETAELADVVLPVTQWAEETGTTTSLEGRVLLRRRALAPPPGVHGDLYVLHELSARLGVEKGFPTDPEEVFEELRRASEGGPADYSGITYRRLAEETGVFWPCPEGPDGAAHPGTPRLFLDRFATPDGRARFAAVTHRATAEEPDADYPLLLTTGRVVAQYQSGAQTRRVAELNAAAPGPFVELHPRLAARIGAAEGDAVTVTSRRGRAIAPARITSAIRPDTVFMPFHWPGEGRANTLTNPALDPTSRMPEFKSCAVRVEVVGPSQ